MNELLSNALRPKIIDASGLGQLTVRVCALVVLAHWSVFLHDAR